MTLNQVANQVYSLALNGYFNGEHFSKSQFKDCVSSWMRGTHRYIMQIALPDGWWWMSINHYGDKSNQYDYYIPETKGDSDKLLSSLFE